MRTPALRTTIRARIRISLHIAMRHLFVIRELPRPTISVEGLIRGAEPLSGTHTSGVLVAEGLARRGHQIGICVLAGQGFKDQTFRHFPTLHAASQWISNGRVIWISYGDASILDKLRGAGLKPTIWTHLPINRTDRSWLESGLIEGIITVSDTCRVPLLRSRKHPLVGRIYNPLAPAFSEPVTISPDRYRRHVVVYTGAAGPTKGLHRVLEMWSSVRHADQQARLLLVGTARLYGNRRELGRYGMASPEFEDRYVAPLADRFGSLSAAGIEMVGLTNPAQLRTIYAEASLGVVNPNWNEFTETFCCAATEMLATGLPVFSVARGALPETIGRSGGAFLSQKPQPRSCALELTALLGDERRLASLGHHGTKFVRDMYHWDRVVDQWTQLLDHGMAPEVLSGAWRGPMSVRYLTERTVGALGLPWLLDAPTHALHSVRQLLR